MYHESVINDECKKIHCFIVGAKCIGQYGGYETFVMKLLEYSRMNKTIQFHVACKANGSGHMDIERLPEAKKISTTEFEYCGARAFMLRVPEKIGAAQAIYYDIEALQECCEYIEKNHIENVLVYMLACRIGFWVKKYVNRLHSLGACFLLNPDGHEWKRTKWPMLVRKYWKISEKEMVKAADFIICDSINIEKYIQTEYRQFHPRTEYISYGADISASVLEDDDPQYVKWLRKYNLREGQFYISVGRFVPENNFETIIREFIKSKSKKDFVIITTENPRFMRQLEKKLHFSEDKRIKFVGTVYDQELLKKIRENAYGYFHGHEVGGTNPSLLEALRNTKLNLLLDVGFNREVAEDAALYWEKKEGNLSNLIDKADELSDDEIKRIGARAKKRICEEYSWEKIAECYRKFFLMIERK